MSLPTTPRFLDAGETALVVEFGDVVDPVINAQVLALDTALRADPPKGVRECVPTYRSLMIHYDPLQIDRARLVDAARSAVADTIVSATVGTTWRFPCCYELPFAEDLDEVAGLLKLSRDEVVRLHTGTPLRVYMYGFSPGQLYLGGVPERLAISRRAEPRPPQPAGGVSIAGGLSVVVPFVMPTGWYVIGCTPERLYAPERDNPFFIQPGDQLRFEPVDVATYHALAERAGRGEVVARKSAA
ncbi:allophanate hydrolase subunit 1 [Bradyrhizobium jicamae]|uniref:5-oxoprolinase subunit B family protein n=1 Tax=Bradyrhizobium jicamae TaxID=280332 RepID=UPI001BA474E6|nr:allophanate hydrolase subunit 1 [Bradyrhizobium jicamae]MBR0755445.1 allophanate hydrolase subunit 1 [Bradyrhizobium jicamae]